MTGVQTCALPIYYLDDGPGAGRQTKRCGGTPGRVDRPDTDTGQILRLRRMFLHGQAHRGGGLSHAPESVNTDQADRASAASAIAEVFAGVQEFVEEVLAQRTER